MENIKMRNILITNDDGIDSNGIIRLAKAATNFGKVWVIAPSKQCSAMSHSITLREPIYAHPYDFPVDGVTAYAIDGTPADCVRVGVLNLIDGPTDVIFSGINCGYNTATDMQYSATAGAAFEGSFQGIRSIAFSESFDEKQEVTDTYLEAVIEELIDAPLGYGEIWNVNFPNIPLSDFKGILRDRTISHSSFYTDGYCEKKIDNDTIELMVHGVYHEDAEEGTDMHAVVNGYISIGKARNIH